MSPFYKKVLLTSWAVKGRIAFSNCPISLAQIEDLQLNCCVLDEDSKNKRKEVLAWLANALKGEDFGGCKAKRRRSQLLN